MNIYHRRVRQLWGTCYDNVFVTQKDIARPKLTIDCVVCTVIMLWVTVVWENDAGNSAKGALMCITKVVKDDTQSIQINPGHATPSHLLKTNFNIIFPSTPTSSKWSFSLRSPHQNPARNFPVSHTCNMSSPHSSLLFLFLFFFFLFFFLFFDYYSPVRTFASLMDFSR